MANWQSMETAPRDREILVKHDHEADIYHENGILTDYAVHCESGESYIIGKGVCIAHWCDSYDDDNGWESGQSWTMPPVWRPQLDGENTDYVIFPVAWMEIPQ